MQCLLLKNNTSPHVLKVRVTSVDKWTNSGEIRKQVFSPTARNDEKQKLEIQIDGTATEGLVHTGAEVTNFTKILASRFAPSGGKYSFVCLFFLVFQDRVSLCSPGCPGIHFVDQAGLELRNPPASASRVLGLKACATTPGDRTVFLSELCGYNWVCGNFFLKQHSCIISIHFSVTFGAINFLNLSCLFS